ncbi:MAG: hypothetical protein RJA09_929 [Pseudomonadota bacterium]|jgi:hypothetical protein
MPSYSLQQALAAAPALAQLTQRIQQSQAMLGVVHPLLPAPLRPLVRSGPVEEGVWCVLVNNPAVATKLRHLTPALLAALRNKGYTVERLRIKVQWDPLGRG